MPCSGMKSSAAALGAATGWVLTCLLLGRSRSLLHDCAVGCHLSIPMHCVAVPLHAADGQHRPANRCAAAPGRPALVPEHRDARLAERAGGQAARRPARGGGGRAGLYGARRSRPLRLGDARVRGAVLRGPDGRGGGARGRRAPSRGRGRLHGRRRGERDVARARARHVAPRGGARADPRPQGRHADADADRALDAVRAAVRRGGPVKVLDLTRPLDERTVLWPGSVPFVADEDSDDDGFWWRNLRVPEHAGTHVDAPRHLVESGDDVAAIPAERLVVPAVRIDGATGLSAAGVEEWEREHGSVPEGSAVLLRTGWDGDPLAAPGFEGDAAELLVARGVLGLGIDTLSVDACASTEFPVHRTTLPAGLWHLEN